MLPEHTALILRSLRSGRLEGWRHTRSFRYDDQKVKINGRRNQFKQHFLNFLPLPHGQGSLRPILGPTRTGM